MKKRFVLVVYDISNDKRRTRLHKRLKDFGSPVQYSVFECLVTDDELALMKKAVFRVIRSRIDHVRFYPICASCYQKIQATANHAVTAEKQVFII